MSILARAYLWALLLAGAALAILAMWRFDPGRAEWPLAVLLIALATIAQLSASEAPLHQLRSCCSLPNFSQFD